MAIDRATIIDAAGRRVGVEKRPIPAKPKNGEDAASASDGPKNARELAVALDQLSSDARRIPAPGSHKEPEAFHIAKSELARRLDRLSQWARRQVF